MDQERILDLLKKTADPNPAVREPAEAQLNSIHKIIGFTPGLLDIVLNLEIEIHLRQAAVIYLKNNVGKYWDNNPNATLNHNGADNSILQVPDLTQFQIHQMDKDKVTSKIVDAIVQCRNELLTVHLASIVNLIIKADFPHKWPGVVDKIHHYLMETNDPHAWQGALTTFYQLAKVYEYKNHSDRKPFIGALEILLPDSCQRLQQLLQQNDSMGELSCKLQKSILKTLHAILQYSLPLNIVTQEVFSQWMLLIIEIAKRDIPEALQKDVDIEERPNLIWWKCKKWSLHLLARTFERYGSPNTVSKEYKQFAQWYISTFSFSIIQTIIKILELYALGQYVSPRVMQQALNYLNTAVLHSMTWKMLKSDMMVVIEKIIFPLMCHSNEDEELWQTDPREFIRMKFDIFEEYVSPVSASQNLLHSLCKKRKEMLQKTMTFVINVLNNPQADPKAKDGALHMIGSIANVLLKKNVFKDQIEQLLVTYVFPLFSSQQGHLRARACWVLNYFSGIEFKNDNNLIVAAQSTLQLTLADQELPVKVEAALCLQCIIHCQEKSREYIQPHIKPLTLELVQIIRNTESEDVMEVLQKIVYLYPDDIYPIAVDMTNHLAQTFHQLISSGDAEEDDKVSAAMAILGTIDTVITMMDERRDLMNQLEPIVVGVVLSIFEKSCVELYEEATTLLSTLTADLITPETWRVYETLYVVFKRNGSDYFTDMMSPIHNYITVDPQNFISSRNNLGIVYDMCQSILNDPDGNEEIESYAAKLLEIVILQFRNQIDDCIPSFVELAIMRLRREIVTAELRTLLLQIVISAFFSNYQLLFSIFEKLEQQSGQPNTLFESFLKQWFKDIDELVGLHDRKMSLIGFCTLIILPADKRPQIVTQLAHSIVPSILNLCDRLKIAYQKKARADSDSDDSDEDDEDDDSEQELEVLEDDQDHVASHLANDDDDDEFEDIADDAESETDEYDDYESDDDCEPTALESFETLIDTPKGFVDEFILLRDTMESIRQNDFEWYRLLLSPLDAAQQKRLAELGEYINKRQNNALKTVTNQQQPTS